MQRSLGKVHHTAAEHWKEYVCLLFSMTFNPKNVIAMVGCRYFWTSVMFSSSCVAPLKFLAEAVGVMHILICSGELSWWGEKTFWWATLPTSFNLWKTDLVVNNWVYNSEGIMIMWCSDDCILTSFPLGRSPTKRSSLMEKKFMERAVCIQVWSLTTVRWLKSLTWTTLCLF